MRREEEQYIEDSDVQKRTRMHSINGDLREKGLLCEEVQERAV